MSEEEAIEILKIDLENTKRANECGLATKGEFDKQIQAIETILDLYQQEKEKNNRFEKFIENGEYTWKQKYKETFDYVRDRFIDKDKIKAKIEELDALKHNDNRLDRVSVDFSINKFKELLEEK